MTGEAQQLTIMVTFLASTSSRRCKVLASRLCTPGGMLRYIAYAEWESAERTGRQVYRYDVWTGGGEARREAE